MGSASQVVGSLPHGEVFAAPVFNQVHQEQLAGGEIPENLVEIPVVQKQVIVLAPPHVDGSLPPVAEFTSPMYNPVHQEQFSAGDTAEDFAVFPVVQEQVLVGLRPAPLSEVAGPQCAAATGGYVAAGAPSLSVVLVSDMMHDDITVQYLLKQSSRQAELDRRKRRVEEEEKAKEKKEKAATAKELVVVPGVGKWIELVDSDTGRTYFWNPQSNVTRWTLPGSSSSSSTPKRKKKKRRKRKTPKLLLLVAALIVDSGSGMCQVGLSGVVPRAVFPSLVLLVTMHIVLCFLRLSRLLMKPVAIPQVQFLYKVICPL